MMIRAFAIVCVLSALSAHAKYYRRLQVTNPVGTTIWLTGESVQITWKNITPDGIEFPPTSHLRLKRFDDPTFNIDLALNYTTDKYAFNWKVPPSLANSDGYYVRIFPQRANWTSPITGGRLPDIIQANSDPFLIVGGEGDLNQLAFLQPKLNTVWTGGDVRYIQWTFEDATPDALISILLENDRWLPTPLVVASERAAVPGAANIVGFKWAVPKTLRSSTKYRLRIVAQYTGADVKAPVSSLSPFFSIQQIR